MFNIWRLQVAPFWSYEDHTSIPFTAISNLKNIYPLIIYFKYLYHSSGLTSTTASYVRRKLQLCCVQGCLGLGRFWISDHDLRLPEVDKGQYAFYQGIFYNTLDSDKFLCWSCTLISFCVDHD